MNRLFAIVASTVVAGLVGSNLPAQAQPGSLRSGGDERARRAARTSGNIEGVVLDERGVPLAGVTVSALGSSHASVVTDRRGTFVLRALPTGSYLVRAQRAGYAPTRRQFVQVVGSSPVRFSLTLQRAGRPGDVPGLLAAGVAPVGAEPLAVGPGEADSGSTEDHGETAWRLRHLKRSILKEAERATIDGNQGPAEGMQPGTVAFIARAMGAPAHLFSDLPFSGEFNFLTSGSFDGNGSMVSSTVPVRQVAFLSVGGPARSHGEWSAQFMAQGDLGSWFLAGSYRKHGPARHLYDIAVSYSAQHFTPGSRWPIAVGSEGERTAGTLYASDEWTLSPYARLGMGVRYARYDYLGGPGLFSPRVSLTLIPVKGWRVQGAVSRRMLAPGAEEFLEPLASGPWVPPERTFLAASPVVAERTDHFELALERDLPLNYVLTVRSFYQKTGDQQLALFGVSPAVKVDSGHYLVGNHGDVNLHGWSVGLSNTLARHVRGSVTYSVSSADWLPGTASHGLLLLDESAASSRQRLHDVTTSLETDIPLTATQLFIAWKLNNGFVHQEGDGLTPRFNARFDVQVLQRLPFLDFTSARWQVMVAVRNLFRDNSPDASVYDELLVLSPPTRVVTGLLVRF